jgi:citronellol/citronellal dehydrogenase
VNALAPVAAVATEGASALLNLAPEYCEPVSVMTDAALALCTVDAAVDSGRVVRSQPYLRERGLRS